MIAAAISHAQTALGPARPAARQAPNIAAASATVFLISLLLELQASLWGMTSLVLRVFT